jgi:hypothetical protein
MSISSGEHRCSGARAAGYGRAAARRGAGGGIVGAAGVAVSGARARDGARAMAHDVAVPGARALGRAAGADVDSAVARAGTAGQAAVAAGEDAVARGSALQGAVGRALDVAVAGCRADAVGALAHAVSVFAVGIDVTPAADEETDDETEDPRSAASEHPAILPVESRLGGARPRRRG